MKNANLDATLDAPDNAISGTHNRYTVCKLVDCNVLYNMPI